ncbi:uncharacterized protein LOC107271120 [Cephus cinctus]|uniref:Uncharacterized protein LOC107271120 n=1 Tax=Cephus cinctus TaxID=211228 RepID=A0AAJ7RNB2_CEPCN|nr:uncharacterized protein LOC107271120 [Cephus cinctus]
MSCLSALHSQVLTYLSVPHEVLFLQHKVFREYAKIAVGPDFIHTLPSFIILTAIGMTLWKNPPVLKWLDCKKSLYKTLQISVSWFLLNSCLWLWLIFQRVLYCSVWSYWSYESEYRGTSYPWWQRVWSSYYPPPVQPPVLSAGFISWIISMIVAITSLGCAISTCQVLNFLQDVVSVIQDILVLVSGYLPWSPGRMPNAIIASKQTVAEESEGSSVCDECRSELSTEVTHPRREIHPISYGTNWTPRPNFSSLKDVPRKTSMKSLRTVMGITETKEPEDKYSPRQLRHRRGCHTVIPSNSSDKSSGC